MFILSRLYAPEALLGSDFLPQTLHFDSKVHEGAQIKKKKYLRIMLILDNDYYLFANIMSVNKNVNYFGS